MKKNEFLSLLEKELHNHHISDTDDILAYYDDVIDGKIEKGLLEEDVVSEFDIKSIILDVKEQNTSGDKFTYGDFIGERLKIDITGKLITPKKQNDHYVTRVPIEEAFSLKINTWDRSTSISSYTGDHLTVKYKKRFLKPIETYHDKDSISIIERKKNLWILSIFNMAIFAALFIGFMMVFKSLLDKSAWWYFLVFAVSCAAYTILYLPYLLYSRKEDKVVEILVPNHVIIKDLKVTTSDGKSIINSVVVDKLNVRILTGRLELTNFYFSNGSIKISSGKAFLDNSVSPMKKVIESLNISVSSGKLSLDSLSIHTLKGKVSSGTLSLNRLNIDTFKVNLSSGSIKGNHVFVKDDITSKISSGNLSLSDVSFDNLDVKIFSGSAKLSDIIGSEDDYLLNINSKYGSVKINDNPMSTFGYKLVNELPNKQINMTVSTGYIRLNFIESTSKK